MVYFPSDPPVPTDVSGARVALLIVTPRTGELRLLETKKAETRQEWVLPEDAEVVAAAYGPNGLDEDKMRQATTKDPELIAQLAEYSEKTMQTEMLLSALSGRRQSDDRAVEAALQGLASTNGGQKLDRSAPMDQQTMTLFRALNPAIGSYDPLAPEAKARWQQSATLASSVAGLFFGSNVGLAGGGAALFLNMRSMLFPKTELRSALLREAPEAALCAAKAGAARTKFAYLWARRLPLGEAPKLRLAAGTAQLATGLPAVLAVEGGDADLNAAGRAHRWKLVDGAGKDAAVTVSVPANEKALRLAPVGKKVEPGVFKLVAEWDWEEAPVAGEVRVHALPDVGALRLTRESAGRLVSGTGPVRARMTGATTYFLSGAQLKRAGDALARTVAVPFAAAADGQSVELEIDTAGLAPGPYVLTLVQQGGGKAEVPVTVQSRAPEFAGLPVSVHTGETETVEFSGSGLERVTGMRAAAARIEWDRAARRARVTLNEGATGELDVEVIVEGRTDPVRVARAIRVLGPRARIVSMTRAPQQAGTVERRSGEIDAATPAAYSLRVENMGAAPRVALSCREKGLTPPLAEARPTGDGLVYFTMAGGGPAGCTVLASVDGSEPVELGRTVRLPVISGFVLSDQPGAEAGTFQGVLRGEGLEAIERTGWEEAGRAVTALPAPGQTLEIEMPWPAPAPHARLRIWLRGERDGRLTTARY